MSVAGTRKCSREADSVPRLPIHVARSDEQFYECRVRGIGRPARTSCTV
jgi:hypothetical protein